MVDILLKTSQFTHKLFVNPS